jgi:epoxyqueuosine reductase
MNAAEARDWVVAQARVLGFDLCGVAPAADFDELAHLPDWLARGYAGEMRYLHDPRRRTPQAVLPGARSVIVCALNYNTPFPYSTDARVALTTLPKADAEAARPQHQRLIGRRADESPDHSIARSPDSRGWISRYAWGDDYHDVLDAKLDALLAAMRAQFSSTPFRARAYVDTGPVHERIAAHHAGLGWLGKNTCLINDRLGSWLFLGVILTTLELEPSQSIGPTEPSDPLSNRSITKSPDHPMAQSPDGPISLTLRRTQGSEGAAPTPSPYSLPPDLCGQCTQCLDACPTGALVAPYVLDARRCISYLIIELRGPIPAEFHSALGWHLFGCDICQDVCPFNRRAPATSEPRFYPRAIPARVAFGEARNNGPTHPGLSAAEPPLDDPIINHPITHSPDDPIPLSSSAPSATSAVKSFSLFAPPLDQIASLSESDFRSLFRHSAIKRTKHAGLSRNAALAGKNSSQ